MYELWLDMTGSPVLRQLATNHGWYPSRGIENTIAAFTSPNTAWNWPPVRTPIQRISILDTVEEFFTDYPEYFI